MVTFYDLSSYKSSKLCRQPLCFVVFKCMVVFSLIYPLLLLVLRNVACPRWRVWWCDDFNSNEKKSQDQCILFVGSRDTMSSRMTRVSCGKSARDLFLLRKKSARENPVSSHRNSICLLSKKKLKRKVLSVMGFIYCSVFQSGSLHVSQLKTRFFFSCEKNSENKLVLYLGCSTMLLMFLVWFCTYIVFWDQIL